MRWFRLPLLALALFVPCALADEPPKDEPEKPIPEPEAPIVPGHIRLSLDAGGHTGHMTAVLFTPDSKHLITAASDHSIRLWEIVRTDKTVRAQTVRVLRPPGGLTAMAVSPDGDTLAVGFSHRDEGKVTWAVALLALEDGRVNRVLRGPTGWVGALAFTPDGKRLAAGGADKTLCLWDLKGKEDPDQVIDVGKTVFGLAFSPDGTRLVEAHDGANAVIRDLADGKVTPLKGTKAPGWWSPIVAWSRDGKTIATGSENGLWLWEPDGKMRHHLLVNRTWATSVDISPDSRRVLVTSWSTPEAAWVFDVHTGKQDRRFTDQHNPHEGVFSPDGTLAATAGDVDNTCDVVLWKPGNGAVVKDIVATSHMAGPDLQAGWGSGGKTVSWKKVANNGQTRKGEPTSFDLADLQFGKHLQGNQFHGAVTQQGPVSLKQVNATTAQVLKDGKHLVDLKLPPNRFFQPGLVRDPVVFAGKDRAVVISGHPECWIYDVHTGKLLHTLGAGNAYAAAGSPDGRYLATLSRDQVLRVWSMEAGAVEDGKLLVSLFVVGHDWIAWTPQGYYAASPGGERRVGWVVDNGIDRTPTFYPAERFRKVLYRPDAIKLLLDKGNLADALAAANAALKQEGEAVAEGVADVEQLLPPRASLEVLDKTALPKVKLKATAEAAVKGQPVTTLRLLVDGRPLPDGEGTLDLKEGQPKAEATWEVALPPGEHELKVLARGPATAGASPAVALRVPIPAAAARPTLHVVAVGINAYQQQALRLGCAVADAEGLADAFAKDCAGPANLFGEARVTPLLDKGATRCAVLCALEEARQAVKPGDLLVFSFAGHGVKQGRKFYLLTADADPDKLAETALSGDSLRAALADMPCQVLLLLDACHSAAGVRAFSDEATGKLTDDECGVAVLCAAMGAEEAQEKNGHGLFTKAVLEALGDGVDVLYNRRDHRQYVHHLGTFVQDAVKDWSNDEQHPFLTMPYVTESFPIRQMPPRAPDKAGSGER
jgi:WD40 repeat protein